MNLSRTGNGSTVVPEPIRGSRGASILGPRNVPVEIENTVADYQSFVHRT
jgi:hypothetical protein